MDPLPIDVPERIETERLLLRRPQPGDGVALNAAVGESLGELKPWLPWAQTAPTVDESDLHCRRMHARFALREDLVLLLFERRGDGSEGALLGGSGLHRLDWNVPRFEIGYWRRSGHEGHGLVGEAVRAHRGSLMRHCNRPHNSGFGLKPLACRRAEALAGPSTG